MLDMRSTIVVGLGVMQLSKFLEERGETIAEFAERINLSHEAVRRYAARERIPRADIMPRIIEATAGQVQPNDFFEAAA